MPKNFQSLTFFNAGEFDVVLDAALDDTSNSVTVDVIGSIGAGATVYHNVFVSFVDGDTREVAFATSLGAGSMTLERGNSEFGYAKHVWASGTRVFAYMPRQVLEAAQYASGFGGGDIPETTISIATTDAGTVHDYTLLPGTQIVKLAYHATHYTSWLASFSQMPKVRLVSPAGARFSSKVIIVSDFTGPVGIISSDNTTAPNSDSGAGRVSLASIIRTSQIFCIDALVTRKASIDTTRTDYSRDIDIEGDIVLWSVTRLGPSYGYLPNGGFMNPTTANTPVLGVIGDAATLLDHIVWWLGKFEASLYSINGGVGGTGQYYDNILEWTTSLGDYLQAVDSALVVLQSQAADFESRIFALENP